MVIDVWIRLFSVCSSECGARCSGFNFGVWSSDCESNVRSNSGGRCMVFGVQALLFAVLCKVFGVWSSVVLGDSCLLFGVESMVSGVRCSKLKCNA